MLFVEEGGDAIQLNKSTDYAIRILLYLGSQQGPCSSSNISTAMKIPERQTSSLLKMMARKGILHSFRGKDGGYRLNGRLQDISMYDVITWTTKETKINACLADPRECSRNHAQECKVRQCFCKLQVMVEDRLQSIRLNEFI